MTVTKRVRYEVLKRDNHACRYCGAVAPDVVLTVDHVVPVALGGSDAPENLVAACRDCNGGKSSVHPGDALVADVAQDALRWAGAMRQAAAESAAAHAEMAEYVGSFSREWAEWTLANGEVVPLPHGWSDSVERFKSSGVPVEMLVDSVGRAMRRRGVKPDQTFRYMCGIVWSRLTQMQDRARTILAAEDRPPADPLLDAVFAWQMVDETKALD